MIIKKYSDLEKIKEDRVVDLSELSPKQYRMAINFLAGLTWQKGSLTKIARGKFWVRLEELR